MNAFNPASRARLCAARTLSVEAVGDYSGLPAAANQHHASAFGELQSERRASRRVVGSCRKARQRDQSTVESGGDARPRREDLEIRIGQTVEQLLAGAVLSSLVIGLTSRYPLSERSSSIVRSLVHIETSHSN